jgi:hypothetical protein
MTEQHFLKLADRGQDVRADLINSPAEAFSGRVDVVYDTIDDDKILKYSKLKNGSGVITGQFGKDLALKIKNAFGERLAAAPDEWSIVSIGSSKFLGAAAAQNLGISNAHIRLDDFSLFRVRNYDAAGTLEERNKIFNSKYFTLETKRNFKARNVILIDDMLNRGISLTKGIEFLEGKHGLHVAGAYVLFTISHVEDASLEDRISKAFINAEGKSALINMLNEEDFFVTRHLLKNIFYDKNRLRYLLMLNTNKRFIIISKGIASISAKVWVLMKDKVISIANVVSGGVWGRVQRRPIK